jgi:superfamily II DNA or RNA helicase
MTREEIYSQCVEKIAKTNCLLIEAATGTGKSKISIDLVNYLISSKWYKDKEVINILILVAKRVHKQTWKDEIEKWGGIHHPTAKINICMECYESLKNHCKERWDIVLADEVHHIGSDVRLDFLKTMSFGYFIGLSATISRKLKQLFKYRYHSDVVSCDIIEAIEDDILPEPQILLFPLILDNRKPTEEWEINAKAGGKVFYGEYKDLWKFKKQKVHAILSCTQKQKLIEYDKLIEWFKKQTMMSRNPAMERSWLYQAGKRHEFLADCKLGIVNDILMKLAKERTITFCKTIEQAETVGEYCIHSQNAKADDIYEKFNKKKINHITAVNILNENANLVDCKYAVFCNLSSSERIYLQRIGRSLRHKSPVIILPYFQGTREQEVVEKMTEGFNKDYIKTIHSIQEI